MKHKRKRGSGYDPHVSDEIEVQITEFVKQWIPAQLHSEADASKDGQIRPHIRPGPDMAGYENLAGFRPGPDMISGATLCNIQNNATN